ncbi:MAG: hypothetical protein IJU47_03235 [Verrucomicrobia bacterium]|nr:hypothetical protein [Verrucomicrobiota bacterium]
MKIKFYDKTKRQHPPDLQKRMFRFLFNIFSEYLKPWDLNAYVMEILDPRIPNPHYYCDLKKQRQAFFIKIKKIIALHGRKNRAGYLRRPALCK